MRVRTYIYDGVDAPVHVDEVLAKLDDRDEAVDRLDVAAGDDPDAARRDAMLTLRESLRIGENPADVYGDDGSPDFSPGVLITEAATGRRTVHVGRDALAALAEADEARDE